MREEIKHFLLWITGPGKWVLFSLPPAILILQAIQAAKIGYKAARDPKALDEEVAKRTNTKRKLHVTAFGAATFVFFFYLIAAYVGDRL